MKRSLRQRTGGQTPPPATISFHKEEILRFSAYGVRLTPLSSCAELIDVLLAVCRGEPEFLRPESLRRYLGLLSEFKSFVAKAPVGPLPVVNQAIREISPVLHKWIHSYFRSGNRHPILPSYALDTAMFVISMVRGAQNLSWDGAPTIEVEPLVSGGREIGFDFDTGDKRDFTNANPLRFVVCRVPPNGQVRFNYTDKRDRILGPGEEFEFKTGRCYLSITSLEGTAPIIIGEEPYRVDLQSEFKFPGHLEGPPDNRSDPPKLPSSYRYSLLDAEVPGHWVIAALDRERNRFPVPFGES